MGGTAPVKALLEKLGKAWAVFCEVTPNPNVEQAPLFLHHYLNP